MVRFSVVYQEPEDPTAFDRHYREVHIPRARKLPGLRRYTISRDVAPIRGGDPYYYLVAELDWNDMPALQRAFHTPEGRATADDVANLAAEGKVRSVVYELEDALQWRDGAGEALGRRLRSSWPESRGCSAAIDRWAQLCAHRRVVGAAGFL